MEPHRRNGPLCRRATRRSHDGRSEFRRSVHGASLARRGVSRCRYRSPPTATREFYYRPGESRRIKPDFSPLAKLLGDEFDGYLISADGSDSNQLYPSRFDASDPYVTLYTPTRIRLLVSALEFGRMKKENRANAVSRLSDYDYRDNHTEHGAAVGKAKTVAAFLADHGADSLAVPTDFPLGTASALREEGVTIDAEADDILTNIRIVKADEEVERIHTAQNANEAAMRTAEGLVRDADVADDDTLAYEGEPLTSGRVREEIEVALLHHGYTLNETIIACGADTADPYDRGSGPLRTDEAVIIDIFLHDKEIKYNSGMTRTFVKGEPSPEIREWFDLTGETSEAALDAVEPGATGKDVHDAVCNVYETAGESTLRADPSAETGFIHSAGHDVGLNVHELPSLGPSGEELQPGHVITIGPRLYGPEIGDVRIEDLVVATGDGYENLTEYPVEFVIG